MAMLGKLVRALAGAAVCFVLIGLMLPKTSRVEREIWIDRPPAAVFAMLDSYRRFNEWSPWFARDPNAEYAYDGPASGLGAGMRWVSRQPDVGSGRQTIVEREPVKRIVVKLQFDDRADAYATYTLTGQGRGTRVVWAFETAHGMNPLSRWFGLLFDRYIGPDYARGLANLKTLMETGGR